MQCLVMKRCWKYDWVIEFDIKGLFYNINHVLLMQVVRKHCDKDWMLLYVERWLKVPIQCCDSIQYMECNCGTSQVGVISPL